MDRTLRSFDFYALLGKISSYARTGPGRDLVLSIRPFVDDKVLEERLSLIEEGLELKAKGFVPPLCDIEGFFSCLDSLAVEGSYASPEDLLSLRDGFLQLEAMGSFLRDIEGGAISSFVGTIHSFRDIAFRISNSILPSGEVKDSASSALKRIRDEKRYLRSKILEVLSSFFPQERSLDALRDEYVTIRNGRFVLPVKSGGASVVKGIVHDRSHRGKTYYVEPFEVVDLNNRYRDLVKDEEDEIARILLSISDSIRQRMDDIKSSLSAYFKMDFVWALVEFSSVIDGKRPVFTEDVYFDLEGSFNPVLFLEKGSIVPFSLKVDSAKRGIVVSGPNGGGKTVFLKALGLIVALSRSGIFVPAANTPRIYPFRGVFSYISDEQDMLQSLSTFTAFISRVGKALRWDLKDWLFIVDELGEGTDVEEGSSLGIAILEEVSRKGGFFVVSTHQVPIKGYGEKEKDVLSLSFFYDEEKKCPTYRLFTGVPGSSRALQVASLHLPESVVNRARSFLSEPFKLWERAVSRLEERVLRFEDALSFLEKVSKESERYIELVKELYEAIRKARKGVRESAYLEVRPIIRDARRLIKELRKRERLTEDVLKKAKSVEEKTSSLGAGILSGEGGSGDIKPGDVVTISGFKEHFTVVSVDRGSSKAKVRGETLRMEVPISMLTKVNESQFNKNKAGEGVFLDVETPSINEVRVIGKNRDDAIFEVEKFLDRAILSGWESIRVIHGVGTGRLREGIWSYFSSHPLVRSIKRGENPGVTVIEVVRS